MAGKIGWALVAGFRGIVEALRLTGETDHLPRFVVPTIEVYGQVCKRLIARLEFRDVNLPISMEGLKLTTAVPLNCI